MGCHMAMPMGPNGTIPAPLTPLDYENNASGRFISVIPTDAAASVDQRRRGANSGRSTKRQLKQTFETSLSVNVNVHGLLNVQIHKLARVYGVNLQAGDFKSPFDQTQSPRNLNGS